MRGRRAALALLCALVLPLLAACTAQATPLCDQAAKLADGHRLGAALSRYVDAERAGEGGCAVDGRSAVVQRQAKVALVLAQASSAEGRGDVKAAEELSIQALTQDVDNAQARAALARFQATAAVTGTPAPTATPRASPAAGTGYDPVVVILVTVVLLVALATGIIASLAGQRDGPDRSSPPALPWSRGGDAGSRRVERLEARVAFLTEAVERLAAASPVPRVRTEYVAPRRGPQDPDRTTTVNAVTVVRLPADDGRGALLLVCRRLVHDAERPGDELLADLARLGTADAPHLEILLEEAAIAAATKGLLDPSWRVVEEAWQVEDGQIEDASTLVVAQVRDLVLGRPVVLPPSATALPDPLAALARQVAGRVATPGTELPGPARVLLHATGVAARRPQQASVLLTAAVRWLMYEVTADAVVRGLRDGLQPPSELPSEARSGAPSETPSAPRPDDRGPAPAGPPGPDDRQATGLARRSAEEPAGYGIAHLLEHPRRPGAPPGRA